MSNLVLLVAVAPPMGQWGSYSDSFSPNFEACHLVSRDMIRVLRILTITIG